MSTGSEILSSLPLQMSLYFNICFAPFWVVTHIVTAYEKIDVITPLSGVVTIATLVVMSLLEGARLYLGYAGNLQERVSQLAGCLLITLILQLPLLSILIYLSWTELQLPLDLVIDLIFAVFLATQIIACYTTLKQVTARQRLKFEMQGFEEPLLHSKLHSE